MSSRNAKAKPLRPRVDRTFVYANHADGWEVEVTPRTLGPEATVTLSVWGRKPLRIRLGPAQDLEEVRQRLADLGANLVKAGNSLGRRPLEEP